MIALRGRGEVHADRQHTWVFDDYYQTADTVATHRSGTSIILHRNWRGLYEFATDTDGDQTTCSPA